MSGSKQKSAMSSLIPIAIMAIAVPLALLLWLGNMAFSFVATSRDSESDISPMRWFISTLTPIFIAAWGLKKKSLDISGALLGLVVGFVLTLSSYCFLACLLTFFVTSSKATKFRSDKKKKLEKHFKEGGQRNWLQVLCNGGIATYLGLLYIIDSGCGERAIDFSKDYRASWLGIGILGAFACCNGDTWASELGTVIGGEPFLITTRKRVPRGTNGGVTFGGLLFSLFGGMVIGLAYYVAVIYSVDSSLLLSAPSQWPIIVAGGLAGFFGSLLDSILGATIQFSGIEEKTGIIVELPSKGVKHVSGLQILDNHSINLVSSICMGLITPWVANLIWP